MAPAFHHPVQADIDPSSRAMRDLSGRKNLHIKIIVGIAAAGRLEQHAGGSSDLGLGERPARFPAQPDERLRPLLFDRRRNLIRQGGGGGAGARRIFKDVAAQQAGRFDGAAALLKFRFGLAGKARDQIGGDEGFEKRLRIPSTVSRYCRAV